MELFDNWGTKGDIYINGTALQNKYEIYDYQCPWDCLFLLLNKSSI
jgi:hypothetical protein